MIFRCILIAEKSMEQNDADCFFVPNKYRKTVGIHFNGIVSQK
jgi:hypothetical protein